MKALKDLSLLNGEIEVISATEFQRHVGECLSQVTLGKVYCIKRRGEVVAFLGPSADIVHEIKANGVCETGGLMS